MKTPVAWFCLHVDFVRHTKLAVTARALGIHRGALVDILIGLWSWAAETRSKDGRLTLPDDALARLIYWDQYAPATPTGVRMPVAGLLEGLERHRWLDRTSAGYVIHEWALYGGDGVRRREAEAARKQAYRERQAAGRAKHNARRRTPKAAKPGSAGAEMSQKQTEM
jgi:hypothetical protein